MRTRSPFRGATKGDIRMLRALAREVRSWEHAAAAGRYYMLPAAWRILGNGGGIYQARVLDEFEARALRRLRSRPNSDQIWEARRVAYMRHYDSRAYEVYLLRQEVKNVQTRVRRLESGNLR